MKKYVKSERGYAKTTFDSKKIETAYGKAKKAKKHPTSINLSTETVMELKRLAAERGVPYQTLMRMFVLEGLARLKNAA
jgi:predicted DNA binding CopG/RHH family protein